MAVLSQVEGELVRLVATVTSSWEDKFQRKGLFWLVASEGSALGGWVAEVCIGRRLSLNGKQ